MAVADVSFQFIDFHSTPGLRVKREKGKGENISILILFLVQFIEYRCLHFHLSRWNIG